MKFKKKVKAILSKLGLIKVNEKLEKSKLFGVELLTTSGTIRNINDKDDAWFYELSKNNSNILDVGCNIGFMGIIAKLANSKSSLIMIDPNPLAMELTFKNMMLNKLTNYVTFINAFVGEKAGVDVKFYALTADQSGSMFRGSAQSAASVNAFFFVQSTTLDKVCQENNFKPDFIKIDVEGAESYVLAGSKEIAIKFGATFLVEMHSPEEMPMLKNAELVLNWCTQVNYKAYYMTSHQMLEKAEDIAHRGKCHLLLLPINSEYPEYLKSIEQNTHLSK
jgi:FkbM family methyltransferase